MSLKVVLLFQDVTQGQVAAPSIGLTLKSHIGGWSETYYSAYSASIARQTIESGSFSFPGLIPARALLLPRTSLIIGYRLYTFPGGKGSTYGFGAQGVLGYTTDTPQMGLLLSAADSTGTRTRRWTIRAIPDIFTQFGEFAPDNTYRQSLLNYFQALNNFYWAGQSLPVIDQVIQGCTTLGLCKVLPPVLGAFAPGNNVIIHRAKSPNGSTQKWKTRVASIDGVTGDITVSPPPPVPLTGGFLKLVATPVLLPFVASSIQVNRTVVKKIGRPFEQYRGRASKRRPLA